MSTASGRKSTSVTRRLVDQAHFYSFFQAVRLLERASFFAQKQQSNKKADATEPGSKPVGYFSPPDSEAMRFRSYQALTFPSSEIFSIDIWENPNGSTQWELIINFLGLTGAMGVLPYHYTETILQRLKLKDESMMRFFDLFNHRTASLFYQAGTKYWLPIEYERKRLNPPIQEKHDSATHALLSVMGLGTANILSRMHNSCESLVSYAGLFSMQIRSATGLQSILQYQFGIPVQLNEFVGQWQDLIDDVRTRLPSPEQPKGQNACLGRSVMLGAKGWFAQGKVRIVLGPLNKSQLRQFAPGKSALKSLNEFVRLYMGMEIDYDYVIRVKRSDIPDRIRLTDGDPPIIGWSTWLANRPEASQDDDTLDIVVTANRLL